MPRSSRVSIQTHARNDLSPSVYSSVDAFLKSTKATSRRLQVASTTLGNEEQLLQRIFYKGKNQHRSALFWRRVAELRRYSERAKQLNLPGLVLRLRSSFFGEDAISNQSLLKGAWNHCPEPKALDEVLSCVADARALFSKFQERAMDAYSSFTVSMQSGAFIQILLVMAAISARMNVIAQEYLVIMDGLSLPIQDLKRALMNPPILTKAPHIKTPTEESPPQASGSRSAYGMEASETITRQQPNTIVAKATDIMPSSSVAGKHQKLEETPRTSTPGQSSFSKSKPTTLALKAASPKPKVTSSKGKEKKKRKKDEIDEIFGF